jgi:hypothetical protein
MESCVHGLGYKGSAGMEQAARVATGVGKERAALRADAAHNCMQASCMIQQIFMHAHICCC